MAENWKDLSAKTFKAVYTGWNNDRGPNGANVAYGKVSITLQYDYNSLTTTSAKVRFKLDRANAGDTYEYFDLFYLIFSTTSKSKVTYYTLKDEYTINKTNTYPHYSTSLTLTKAAGEKFTIPEFWFCNDGYDNSDRKNLNGYSNTFKERLYNNYNDKGTRESFRSVHGAKSISIVPSITEIGAATAGTITSITDNGNNTCTITATPGKAGTNDSIASARLYYTDGISGITPKMKFFTASEIADGTKSAIIEAPKDFDKEDTTWHIVAKVELTTTSGKVVESTPVTVPIKLYTSPILNSIPKISYTKNRLTTKEDWTFNWEAAEAGNENSPVAGYRLTLLKNYQPVPATISPGTGYLIPSSFVTNVYTDILGADNCSITLNPADFDFKKGETVCLSVKAFSRNNSLANPEKLFSKVKSSSYYVIESAGTIKVKVGDTEGNEVWTDGQVFVKVGDTEGNAVWVEADDIMIKVSDTEGNEIWVTAE